MVKQERGRVRLPRLSSQLGGPSTPSTTERATCGMTVRLGTAIGVDPEFLSTAAGSVISRSMLLPVPP